MTRPDYRLALFATWLALFVVLLGAWTRLSHAGLGCPDWPGCYGFISVPATDVQQALAALRFPQAPLEADKGWYEMTHRYAAGVLALTVGLLAVRAWRGQQPLRLPLPLLIMVLVAAQAVFGMWTVTLKLWPPVVTVHLLGGMTTLSLLFLLTLRLGRTPVPPVQPTILLRVLATVTLLLVVAQIALGGWVSAHYAAQACPDLPTCQGQWWPPADFAAGFHPGLPIGPSYLGGLQDGEARTAIHLAHRLGAVLVSVGVLVLGWQLCKAGLAGLAVLLLAGLLLQLVLGVSNVLMQFPPGLALAHSAGAALLLMGMTRIHFQLWQAVPERSDARLAHSNLYGPPRR